MVIFPMELILESSMLSQNLPYILYILYLYDI